MRRHALAGLFALLSGAALAFEVAAPADGARASVEAIILEQPEQGGEATELRIVARPLDGADPRHFALHICRAAIARLNGAVPLPAVVRLVTPETVAKIENVAVERWQLYEMRLINGRCLDLE